MHRGVRLDLFALRLLARKRWLVGVRAFVHICVDEAKMSFENLSAMAENKFRLQFHFTYLPPPPLPTPPFSYLSARASVCVCVCSK